MAARARPLSRPVALVTGVGRRAGIGAAIAGRLLADGLDVACASWTPYDERMRWGADDATSSELQAISEDVGGRCLSLEVDLEVPGTIPGLFDQVESHLGRVRTLVMAHCESVDSSILTTTLESFDRHVHVNARATWLLLREYAGRFSGPVGSGRVIALTSDHTSGNLPYGASKGALDRIFLAAARELGDLGVACNVINPGPTDTGWMDDTIRRDVLDRTPLARLGTTRDVANLVSFLCSAEGGWINGQLLTSDGGFSAP
jgi:3-oxoacyl-[acyl-carrier protein] reductase